MTKEETTYIKTYAGSLFTHLGENLVCKNLEDAIQLSLKDPKATGVQVKSQEDIVLVDKKTLKQYPISYGRICQYWFGKVLSENDVRKMPKEQRGYLLENMAYNHKQFVVKTRVGEIYFWDKSDIVLNSQGKRIWPWICRKQSPLHPQARDFIQYDEVPCTSFEDAKKQALEDKNCIGFSVQKKQGEHFSNKCWIGKVYPWDKAAQIAKREDFFFPSSEKAKHPYVMRTRDSLWRFVTSKDTVFDTSGRKVWPFVRLMVHSKAPPKWLDNQNHR